MMKKKILFIISHDLYVRNYIHTGVIDSLNKKYDCKIVASSKLYYKEEVEKLNNFAGYYPSFPNEDNKRLFLMSVIQWRYRKKSTTFLFRFMRFNNLSNLDFFSNLTYFKEFLYFVKRNLHRHSVLIQMIFGSILLYPFFIFFYKRRLTLSKYLEKSVDKINPDIILFPSSAYDTISNDIIEIGAKKKIKTMFLEMNALGE